MLRHAASALAWRILGLAACLVVVLMELVRWSPGSLWPLQGTAVGLLAGSSALCFDERAAAVVDTLPRSLAWRTAARAAGPAVLAAAWSAVVVHAGDENLFGQRDQILVQGCVAVLAGAAFAAWRRSGGADSPGIALTIAVVPLATAWAVVRPVGGRIPIFPYVTESSGEWQASAVGWLTAGALALVLLGLALGDARWWGARVATVPALRR